MAQSRFPSFTTTYHHDQYPAIDPRQAALDCSSKVILITGGGRGIGRAIAVAFAHAHARGIALLGRTKSVLEVTAEEIAKASDGKTDVLTCAADVTRQDQMHAVMNSIVTHFGRVPDVLINNAGGLFGIGAITDVDIDDFWKAFELNVKGPLTVTHTFLRAAKASSNPERSRTIVNLASAAAHLPYMPNAAAYGSAKLAGAKLMEYVHHENPDWLVFNMQPGVVATDLAKQVGRAGEDTPELLAGFAVWLVAHRDARELNGRFMWANWDVDELLQMEDEMQKRDLLTLTLKGWAEGYNAEALKKRVAGFEQQRG